ncbi:hypothetical protein TKK_0002851 [Trichogramma kaykai]
MDFVETNSEDYEDHVVLIACRNTEINQQLDADIPVYVNALSDNDTFTVYARQIVRKYLWRLFVRKGYTTDHGFYIPLQFCRSRRQNCNEQQDGQKKVSLQTENFDSTSPIVSQDPIKSTRNGVVKKASKCKKISILEDEEEEEEEEEKKKKDQLKSIPIKSTHAIKDNEQSEANEISSEEDSESIDEEEEEKQKNQAIMKKTTQKDTLIKRKLLIQTDNLRMKSPASGQGLIDSSSESTVKKSQEKRDSALFENFQKSIEKRSKNTSIPLIPTSDEEDTNNSKEEKERENDHESYDSNNNSPLSHFSTKYRNEMESDNPGSPQKVSFSFCEGKILELQEKIDNLQKENQDLRTAMEKTKILYKKAQEKLSSCFIIQQQMKEFLNDEENQSNLQDYSSMFKSEMNCFNSIRTSTPSDCTTSKNSKRSAKDSGFGEIAKVEKKLKTSEEPQKTIKIIFDKKIPHLPNSSGKRFGTKITPIDSTESMMHLRHSYSIPHEEWKALLKQTSESLFCKKLLEALYP